MKNKETYIIYKATNTLNNKCYIGLTYRGLELRKEEHIRESKKTKNKNFHFHQALRKYNQDVFKWEILQEGINTIKEANEFEIFFINKFNSFVKGYNMTKGGGGRVNYFFSQETRKKMSDSKIGGKLCEEHKKKISLKLKGKPKTLQHKINSGLGNLGKRRTQEQKEHFSEIKKGLNLGSKNPAAIKVNIYNSKQELMFECNGNFETICKANELPSFALRRSYYKEGEPIYLKGTQKEEVLKLYREFKGWYAVKVL